MRCPNGFKQVPAKSGNCVPNQKSKQSETRKTKKTVRSETVRSETKPKSKRCANGTRKNKKTGQCEPIIKTKVIPKVSPKVFQTVSPSANAWKIYRIDYVYPSVHAKDGVKPCEYGSISIESIFLNNKNEIVQIHFENNSVELSFGKTRDSTFRNINWEDSPTDDLTLLNIDADELLGSNTSDIFFSGMENDEDGNFTTKQNFSFVKDGRYGIYVKINNITDPNLDAANINDDIKDQITYESITILNKEFR
jgi:hypothetical protein